MTNSGRDDNAVINPIGDWLYFVRGFEGEFKDDKLNGKGVQIVGIHFPEFGYERELQTVADYAKQWQIQYPIAMDNDAITWNAYEMHAWPAFELIDKYGHRRFRVIGEGGDHALEAAIQMLLADPYTGPHKMPATSYF